MLYYPIVVILSHLPSNLEIILAQPCNLISLTLQNGKINLSRYTQFKWKVVSQFNNLLDFDAMTLGNHEVDFRCDACLTDPV